MDSDDAVRRVRLLEKSVRLMLEAVRANVVTTTIVPAGRDRYIGVNGLQHQSDTFFEQANPADGVVEIHDGPGIENVDADQAKSRG